MISALRSADVEGTHWLEPFTEDFRGRLTALLAGAFRDFPPVRATLPLTVKTQPKELRSIEICFCKTLIALCS